METFPRLHSTIFPPGCCGMWHSHSVEPFTKRITCFLMKNKSVPTRSFDMQNRTAYAKCTSVVTPFRKSQASWLQVKQDDLTEKVL